MHSPLSAQQQVDDPAYSRRRLWGHLLLGTVLLLAVLLFNIHSVGHISEPDDGDCEICLLFGGIDHGLTPSIDCPSGVTAYIDSALEPMPSYQPTLITAFRSRAPPSFVYA